MTRELKTFWIKSPLPHAPMGFGVTAHSIVEAIAIIRAMGYGRYLPEDSNQLRISEGIKVDELDQRHVVPNMNPIVVRGMWYPRPGGVGLPAWAEERMQFLSL